VFSLGSTLYAALEGTPPFGLDGNPMAILHRVGSGRIDPPRRSGALTPLLLGMLAPDPADRPMMLDVANALTGRPVELQTRQDVPPTAVISAQTVREVAAEPIAAGFRSPTEPADRASSAVAANPADRHRPAVHRPVTGRHRSTRAVLVVLALVLAAVTVIGFLLLRNDSTTPGGVAAPTEAPQSIDPSAATTGSSAETSTAEAGPAVGAPPSLEASVPTGPTTAPTTVPTSVSAEPPPTESATQASAQSPPTATTGPSSPTAADLTAAVSDYYALMPGGTDQGWARLTPAFQTEIAGDRQSYESFWNRIDRVVATDISGTPPDRAEATISYYFADGRVAVERTAYRFVPDAGVLKLDSSEVISSSSG
jgi:hypothetical protein